MKNRTCHLAIILGFIVNSENIFAKTLPTATTNYEYDPNGNLIRTSDPLGRITSLRYDTLNRLIRHQLPSNPTEGEQSVIEYHYDGRDQVTEVKDPRKVSTTYTVDGLGNQTQLKSFDSGVTIKTFDAAGFLTSSKDARGQLTTFNYDALGRVIYIAYGKGVPSQFEYDVGSTGAIGRLSKMSDESGETNYIYDAAGRVIQTNVAIRLGSNQKQFTVGYAYGESGTSNDKIVDIAYPSGNHVSIKYGDNGQVTGVALTPPNGKAQQILLSEVQYSPLGDVQSWTWGNSTTAEPNHYFREFDQNGRIIRLSLGLISKGGVVRTLTYDAAGRISKIGHIGNGQPDPKIMSLNQSYDYDEQNRLTYYAGNSSIIRYQYDANGNRTKVSFGSKTYFSAITTSNNQLRQVSGPPTIKNYIYDAGGNITTDGEKKFTYNAQGKLQSTQFGTVSAEYLHNGLGQRMTKIVKFGLNTNLSSETTYFVYDEGGQLIGEYNADGAIIQETIYLGTLPVATISRKKGDESLEYHLYYIHNDQINTPRIITDSLDNNIVWRWDMVDPFGTSQPSNDETRRQSFTYNLRFPGQYFDKETNLHYNYYRHYDPALGRYIQSDPIGIYGGINSYAYVESNPLSLVDELGLAPGDPYPTANAAAIQAVKDIITMSIKTNLEIGGRIYRRKDGRYSYTWPALGTQKDMGQVPPTCTGDEGMYHTHGTYDGRSRPDLISGIDQYWSDLEKKPIWVGTPSGRVLKYTPNGTPYKGLAQIIARGIK